MFCLYLDFLAVWKSAFFANFFAFRLEMHVRSDNQYKTGADEGNIFGQPMLFECMGSWVLSPVHEREVRGYLVYRLIVKYLFHWFWLNSATVYQIGQPCCGIFWWFFETFLEGSVDHIIYRDYIVNRRSFIYCSLATLTDHSTDGGASCSVINCHNVRYKMSCEGKVPHSFPKDEESWVLT